MAPLLTYYSLFDTVRFSPARESEATREGRALAASGHLMLDLLVGNTCPVLSQTQAFDNALLLNLLARHDADSKAFLTLVEMGWIQTRIHESETLLEAADGDGQRFTLRNAFLSALENRSFIFSSWPELADADVRRLVTGVLRGETVEDLPSDALAARVEAIDRLDAAFRQSAVDERADYPSASLEYRVGQDVKFRQSRGHVNAEALAGLMGELSTLAADHRHNLNRRGDWYAVLEEYRSSHLRYSEFTIREMKSIIDLQYNRTVAESLHATSVKDEIEAEELERAQVLRGSMVTPEFKEHASIVLAAGARGEWLSWRHLPELISDRGRTFTPERRLRELVERGYVHHEERDRWVAYLQSMPIRASATVLGVGGMTGAWIAGDVLQNAVVGAAAGAFLTAVTTELAPRMMRVERGVQRATKPLERLRRQHVRSSATAKTRAGQGGR